MLNQLFNSTIDLAFVEVTNPDSSWNNDESNRSHLTEKKTLEYTKNCKKRVLIHKLPDLFLKM